MAITATSSAAGSGARSGSSLSRRWAARRLMPAAVASSTAPRNTDTSVSTRPWPYGCLLSGAREPWRAPYSTAMSLNRSEVESMASAISACEWPKMPPANLMMARNRLMPAAISVTRRPAW